VTGCEDHAVRLFDLKKGENALDCIVTRFQTPVRAVAFSPTGSAIAAGGE
jgi:WD40 repeat protein